MNSKEAAELSKANELTARQALKDFVNNDSRHISEVDARAGLRLAVIEIADIFGKSMASGILVTTDGYFITSYQVISDKKKRALMNIRLYDDEFFEIDKLCAAAKKFDLALVKANIPVVSSAMSYRFSSDPKLLSSPAKGDLQVLRRLGSILQAIPGRCGGQAHDYLRISSGDLVHQQVVYNSSTDLTQSCYGSIVTQNCQVLGLSSYIDQDKRRACYTHWHHALKLIQLYAEKSTDSG